MRRHEPSVVGRTIVQTWWVLRVSRTVAQDVWIAFSERRFHVAEGGFGAGEQNVDPPELIAGEVLAIGLDQIAAVKPFGLGMFGGIELADEGCGLRVVGDVEVAGDAGIALLQSSDRLIDLGGLDELSVSDASRQLVDVGAQAAFLLGADGAVLGDALLAAA